MYCSCHACCHVMACCHAFMSCIVHSCMLTCVSAVLSCIVHVHVMCCVHISRMFLSCCIIVMCDLLARKAGLFAMYSLLTFVRDVMCHNIMHALMCHSIMHVLFMSCVVQFYGMHACMMLRRRQDRQEPQTKSQRSTRRTS